MLWFGKRRHKEIWEGPAEHFPAGDIETAHRIRDICHAAASSSEKLAGLVNRPNNKIKQHETARYEGAKKRALELTKQISDDLLRDTAVRQVMNLCMRANDVETAAVLIEAIQTEKIREEVLNEHPSLR